MAPQDDRDALAYIKRLLAEYNLPSTLATWAWGELVKGSSEAEVEIALRERPEFKREFSEIDLRKKAGLAPMGPGEIVSYRRKARELAHQAGLPAGFYDSNTDFTDLIVGNVSLDEFGQRIALARRAAFDVPPEVRAALGDLGVGDLTALAFDSATAIPMLERRLAEAEALGASRRTGFGDLTSEQRRMVADQGLDFGQVQEGFGNLVDARELFGSLDAGEDVITGTEQLSATFAGNASAAKRIKDRAGRRKATFDAGGGLAESNAGVVGLGTAQT